MERITYESWKAEMESLPKHPITGKISRENFGRFLEFHKALRNRDLGKARRLSRELGVGGKRQGHVS